ncbi:MAG TPA: helix-turn-helix domain-containing protein [Mycobacteriales bacterium]|nr:helix-turn-helix domain-containing protein [Mycobacteriales bacterium]
MPTVGGSLCTVEQAARYLNTTARFIRRLVAERRIAFVKLGRHVRIAEADLARFVQEGRVEPVTLDRHGSERVA